MESDLTGLDFAVLLIDFVAHQHDGDVVTDSGEVLVPLGHVLVSDPGGDVEHEDGCIGANIISLSQTTQLLLAGGVPDAQLDGAVVSIESDGAHFNTLSGNVPLLELSSNVPLDESCLSDSTVSNQHNFELGRDFGSLNNLKIYVHFFVVENNVLFPNPY